MPLPGILRSISASNASRSILAALTIWWAINTLCTPASTIRSASLSLAQVTPNMPVCNCKWARAGVALCCFTCGRSCLPVPAKYRVIAAILLSSGATVFAVANNWTNAASGLWRNSTNWSLRAVPNNASNMDPTQITNAGTKTVTIDAATAAANLSLRGFAISAPAGATNTLRVDNVSPVTPLTTSKAFLVTNGGVLQITNSTVALGADFDIVGGSLILDSGSLTCALNCDLQSGSMIINGGTLTATAGTTGIRMGRFSGANASMRLNGGTVNTLRLTLGSVTGSQNNMALAGGTLICADSFSAAQIPGTTGNVTMTAGNLLVTNGTTKIADRAAATFNQSGGNVFFADLSIGNLGVGTYNFSGGTFTSTPRTTNDLAIIGNLENGDFNQSGGVAVIHNELHVSDFAGVVGNVHLTGGQFFATNDLVAIGREGIGTMTVSNALVVLTNTSVGRHLGATGTLTVQSNASVFVLADLSIGRLAGASGQVLVEGGLLSITNDDLWIGRGGDGVMTVSGGTVRAKSFHVAESDDGLDVPTGSFNMTGGTLTVSSNLTVGTPLISSGHAALGGGVISVTNSSASSFVAVRSGDFTLNGGTLKTDTLIINDTNGSFVFNSGTLQAKGMVVSNGLPFTVGDGVNPAVLELQGGTFLFVNGLVISPNATVTGCGTVIGPITNNGTYNNPCGAAPPTSPTISNLSRSAGTATLSCVSQTGFNYTLEYKNSLGDPAWTPVLPALPGTGGVLNFSDAAATNATRFYRIRVQ